jgi:hypothetical protein
MVNDFYLVRLTRLEDEANAPPSVHRHSPLSVSVSFELVQPDALERTEILESLGDVQGRQQIHGSFEIQAAKLARSSAFPYPAGSGIPPRPDHGRNVLRKTV